MDGDKTSLALYDQILTNNFYHNTYHTISLADQETLKLGLRRLIYIGINGRGSGSNGELTEIDVRRVFRGKTFSVVSRMTNRKETGIPILTENGIDGLWDKHFARETFQSKLVDLNSKIAKFRSELSQTGSLKLAYRTLFNAYPIAKRNFYYKAIRFNDMVGAAVLIGQNIRGIWSVDKFMHLYHAYLSSILFGP